MNAETRTRLMTIVEGAVRPVRANGSRKKAMRLELLAHVTEVFEEELAALKDEAAAVAKTAERFGDPQRVSQELQISTSRYLRAYVWFDDLLTPCAGDSPLVTALRAARNFTIVTIATVTPVIGLGIRPTSLAEAVELLQVFLAPVAVITSLMSFILVRLGIEIRREWFAPAGRRSVVRLAVLLAISCLPVAVGPFVFAAFGGNYEEAVSNFRTVAWILPLVPAALYFGTQQFHREAEDNREWASLQLD